MTTDNTVLRAVEKLFDQSDSVVIAAFQVLKANAGEQANMSLLRRLGPKANILEPRVLVLTVKRSKSDRGFKSSLHSCRAVGGDSQYTLNKSWGINHVRRLTVQPERLEYGGQHVLDVQVEAHSTTAEFCNRYGFSTKDELMTFLLLVTQLLRQQEAELPRLEGVQQEELAAWMSSHYDALLQSLSSFAMDLITPGTGAHASAGGAAVLVSAREERDLEELLDMFAMGIGDVDDFQRALQDEFDALEAANVHAILTSGSQAEEVLGLVRRAGLLLDDLDQSLMVFDTKLRHMRQDISAIEASNNSLELQARNSAKLMEALEELLGNLQLDPDVQRVLQEPPFTRPRLVVDAGWALHKKLQLLDADAPGSLDSGLLNLKVVREGRATLQGVATRFVAKTVAHMSALFSTLAEEALADAGKSTGSLKLKAPNRKKLRDSCRKTADIIMVLRALALPSLQRLQASFCQTLNTVIRKELRTCTADLRKAAALDLALHPSEYNMARDPSSHSVMRERARRAGSDTGSNPGDLRRSSGSSAASGVPNALDTNVRGLQDKVQYTEGGAALALHEAYRALHDTWIPFLLDEADFTAGFLQLYRDQPPVPAAAADATVAAQGGERQLSVEGRAILDQLLAGVDTDLQVLAELAVKSPVMCVPMMAVSDSWLAKLQDRPAATPLVRSLVTARDRLATIFNNFIAGHMTAIEKYESRPTLTGQAGIKYLHVLPSISQFPLLAHRLEILLTDIQDDPAEAHFFDPASPLTASPMTPQPGTEADATAKVRQMVDGVYQRMVSAMYVTLERLAAADAKHGDRLRLENYAYFMESVRPLVKHVTALESFQQHAERQQELALERYVQQQLEYGKVWKLLEFAERVEKLLAVVTPAEVPFQMNASPAEVRALLASTMKDPEKKLEVMFARIRKHLGTSNLMYRVWEEVQAQLLSRYDKLEALMRKCYPSVPLHPSPEELQELFKTTGPG